MTVRGDSWDASMDCFSLCTTLGSEGRRVPSQILSLWVLGTMMGVLRYMVFGLDDERWVLLTRVLVLDCLLVRMRVWSVYCLFSCMICFVLRAREARGGLGR